MSDKWFYDFKCCYSELYADVEKLWNALITTPGSRNVYGLFSEGIDLFREALRCYCNGAFLATLIVCRVVTETTLYYLALTGDITVYNDIIVEKQIDDELKYLDRKKRVESGDWELLLDKLKKKGYLTSEIEKLYYEIRSKGNYAAHWGERARKKMIGFIRKLFNEGISNLPQTIEIWPTRKEAFSQLRNTQRMISCLIERVYEKEIKSKTQ